MTYTAIFILNITSSLNGFFLFYESISIAE